MAFSIKQLFSFNRTDVLDDDPLKDKVKRAMLHRKYGEWAAAVQVLNEALNEAVELGNEIFVSRMYYELATTFWESGQLENAEHLLKLLHGRYLTLHRSSGLSPEVIENSLRLADVYTRIGKLDVAEDAYKYCLTTQMEVMEKHLAEYHVARGAMVEIDLRRIAAPGEHLRICVDSGGCSGFEYKLTLDKRLDEAEDEVIKASEGAIVVVDKLSLQFLRGSKLDFAEDLMRSAFRITDNPLATLGCSCGASFAPKNQIE